MHVYVCVYMCVFVSARECRGLYRPAEGVRSPSTILEGGCFSLIMFTSSVSRSS